MLAYAIDNPAPSTIVLISGDRDFAYALSILRFRRYRIVLIPLPNAHQSLRAQASISFDWVSEVLEPVDPTLSNQPSPQARRGKISSPPAHDKFFSDSMGHNRHNFSSSLFRELYDDKSANSVEIMNNFQDETRCMEIPRTPSKHDAKHDSLPPYLERQLTASSMGLNNGPEDPARVVRSSVPSCHTYPNGNIQTPLTTTASSSESNLSSRTTLTQTCPSQALQKSRLMETSCCLDLLCENPPLTHGSSPLSYQQSSPSPINATQRLSSADRMVVDNNHPGSPLAQSPAANITAKATAPTPSLMPPSSTLSSAAVPATAATQTPADLLQPTSFPVVPVIFKILIQCLKSHRSRGSLRPLRSNIATEVACNGNTYRQAGVLKFGQYVAMAEKAGIVEMGGSESTAWIGLKAPWYNVPLS